MERIVEQHGESILSDPKRVSAFLDDLARDEPKAKKNTLIKCLEQGFPQTLKNIPETELPRGKQRLAQKLYDEEGLDLRLCGEAINLLAAILLGDAPTVFPVTPRSLRKTIT
jgi:hypothetical protein